MAYKLVSTVTVRTEQRWNNDGSYNPLKIAYANINKNKNRGTVSVIVKNGDIDAVYRPQWNMAWRKIEKRHTHLIEIAKIIKDEAKTISL